MAAHRYWGVSLLSYFGGRIALRTVAFKASPGGSLLSAVSASASEQLAQFPAANLIDGDASTAWDTGTIGTDVWAWVMLDFGAPVQPLELEVVTGATSAYIPARGFVWGSDDSGATRQIYADSFQCKDPAWSTLTAYTSPVRSDLPRAGFRAAGASMRLGTAWPAQPLGTRLAGNAMRSGFQTGPYRVPGNVYIDGTPDVPVSRRVRLFNRATAECVREVWSDAATGAYAFEKLPMPADGYFVVAHDHTNVFNAAIKDRISPSL